MGTDGRRCNCASIRENTSRDNASNMELRRLKREWNYDKPASSSRFPLWGSPCIVADRPRRKTPGALSRAYPRARQHTDRTRLNPHHLRRPGAIAKQKAAANPQRVLQTILVRCYWRDPHPAVRSMDIGTMAFQL